MWYHSWGQVKLTEGGKGLKPVDADEDTILRVGVRNGSAAAAHTQSRKSCRYTERSRAFLFVQTQARFPWVQTALAGIDRTNS